MEKGENGKDGSPLAAGSKEGASCACGGPVKGMAGEKKEPRGRPFLCT